MYKELEGYIENEGHKIFYRAVGNRDGIPVIYVHGGPGGSISKKSESFFDLNKYFVILFDQRGCGKSLPRWKIEGNDTFSLVKDMEKIRTYFNIDKWILFGGSWGSTLSLVYAINYADRVISMFLRGIFLGTESEWKWIYEKGSDNFYSEFFELFENFVPEKYRNNKIAYYYEILKNGTREQKKEASFLWANWEYINCTLNTPKNLSHDFEANYQISLLESHYAFNNSFLDDNYILNNADSIKDIKIFIFQGRYDIICPPKSAFSLSKKMNNCEIFFIKESGHSPFEKNLFLKIKSCLDNFIV